MQRMQMSANYADLHRGILLDALIMYHDDSEVLSTYQIFQ